jgi:salicylate hydroxylase
MARKARIGVIGGGIGGLTATHALLRRGFEVEVYESTPELKEIGAGVALGGNAMKALRSLDLEQPVRDIAYESEYQLLRSWKTGRIISKNRRSDRYGATGCTAHRADLLDVLAAGLPEEIVHLGQRCVGVDQHGNTAVAQFRDGSEVEADIIIGADGIHSAVRASLFGPDAPRFTGQVCWRFVVPVDAVPGGLPTTDNTLWLGPHGAIVIYLVRRGELVNVVAHYDDPTWTEESWIREVDCSEAIENYRDWHESLGRLFSATEKHYKWALYDRDPLHHYVKGRAAILGDAAHPMLPYLGQGACQTMEEGCVLAMALDKMSDDLPGALQVYERARQPRASRVVLAAREQGKFNHLASPIAAWKRDIMVAVRRRLSLNRGGRRGGSWIAAYDAGDEEVLTPYLPAKRLPMGAAR